MDGYVEEWLVWAKEKIGTADIEEERQVMIAEWEALHYSEEVMAETGCTIDWAESDFPRVVREGRIGIVCSALFGMENRYNEFPTFKVATSKDRGEVGSPITYSPALVQHAEKHPMGPIEGELVYLLEDSNFAPTRWDIQEVIHAAVFEVRWVLPGDYNVAIHRQAPTNALDAKGSADCIVPRDIAPTLTVRPPVGDLTKSAVDSE